MKRLSAIIVLLLCTVIARSNNVQSISFKHLTTKDGLSSDSIMSIDIDEDGIIWFATGNGLNRYDGLDYTFLSPVIDPDTGKNKRFFCKKVICCRDLIYVGYSNMLYILDRKTFEFEKVMEAQIRGMALKGTEFFFSDQSTIYRMVDGGITEMAIIPEESGEIYSLCFSNDGRTLFAGTEKGHILTISEDGSVSFFADCHSQVCDIHASSTGDIFIGTIESGAYFFDLRNNRTKRLTHSLYDTNSISSNYVRCFCEDESGNIWIGTYTGLDRIEKGSWSISHYKPKNDRPDALSHASVWSIKMDNQGTLWIGTYYGGVNYFNPSFQIYSRFVSSDRRGEGLSSNLVSSIIEERPGKVWIGTEGGGLTLLDPGTGGTEWITVSELNIKEMSLDRTRGHLWIATHIGGVSLVETETGKVRMFPPLPCNDILNILQFSQDSLVVGTRDGVWITDSGLKVCRAILNADGSTISNPRRILYFRGRMYIINGPGKVLRHDMHTCITTESEVEDNDFRGFAQYGQALYLYNISKGLFLLDPETLEITRVRKMEKYSKIRSLVRSSLSGKLVVGLENGIVLYDPEESVVEHFGHNEGFPESTLREDALHCTEDGTIYIGTTDGLLMVNERDLSIKGRPYTMYFVSSQSPERDARILRFSSTNHIPVSAGRPQYRLDGTDWTECESPSEIILKGLSPGHHTLELRCVLRDTRLEDSMCTKCSTEFDIPRPWYGTLAAIIIYILAAISLATHIALKIRRKIIERKDELAKLNDASRKIEEEFMRKVCRIIEDHIGDPGLNVPFLAKELAVSRTNLYERAKKFSGESPSGMIQSMRLEKARELLAASPDMNITEISESVGFSSQKYLSKCFKARYGISPLAYRKSVRRQ